MDNILIFTEYLDTHQETVRCVLEILCAHHLYLKPEKCLFEKLEVEYLGLIPSQGKIAMDPVKVAGVWDWLTQNVTEVNSSASSISTAAS